MGIEKITPKENSQNSDSDKKEDWDDPWVPLLHTVRKYYKSKWHWELNDNIKLHILADNQHTNEQLLSGTYCLDTRNLVF